MNTYDDTFVEELVVRRNSIKNLLLEVLIVLAAAALAAVVWLFLSPIFPAMLVILVFAAYLGIKFQGVEFEYSFTNGDLDVDKIMAVWWKSTRSRSRRWRPIPPSMRALPRIIPFLR